MTCGYLRILTGLFLFFSETVRFCSSLWLPDRGQKKVLGKEADTMKHKLKISVSKEPKTGGIITCRNVSVREKLLRFLFGSKRRVTVLIPGDSIGEIAICESGKGEDGDGRNETKE